jgi:hypothetical protein
LKQSAAKFKAKYPDLGGDMSHSNSLSSKDSGTGMHWAFSTEIRKYGARTVV